MLNIVYSNRASNDIDEIKSFISKDNEYYADKVIETIFNFTNNLWLYPLLGKEISITWWLREIVEPIFRYRIIYKFNGADIVIISILKYKDFKIT